MTAARRRCHHFCASCRHWTPESDREWHRLWGVCGLLVCGSCAAAMEHRGRNWDCPHTGRRTYAYDGCVDGEVQS